MEITSKSLHHSNIVFVFEGGQLLIPDNSVVTNLYQGDQSRGAHFIDDPILQTKVLEVPALRLQVAVEPNRLRIDDFSQETPENSSLVAEALSIYQKLFSGTLSPRLAGFGFNFDIYYQFSEMINLQNLFSYFADLKILEKSDLIDLGTQFTLMKKGGEKQERYFLKIVAPLEIAVHVNHHFSHLKLPSKEVLQKFFENCYNETDEVVRLLNL